MNFSRRGNLKIKGIAIAGVIGIAALLAAVFAGAFGGSNTEARVDPGPTGHDLVVALRGTAEGVPQEIPETDEGTTQGLCFTVDLVDLATGNVIGDATDCLADIVPDAGGGMALTGTTFFNFPGGTVVARGRTTVQPILDGSVDFTHITGAIPSEGDNSVLSGTGRFNGAEGPVRLSGAVNLSKLDSEGKITFDCIFTLSLDK
jgi:hypothetical protein